VHVRESGHGERDHGSGGVELHGAWEERRKRPSDDEEKTRGGGERLTRSERDHGVNEGEIFALKVVDVSEHLGLGVVSAVRAKREESKVSVGRVEKSSQRRKNELEDRLSQELGSPLELLRQEARLSQPSSAQSRSRGDPDELLRSDGLSSSGLDKDVGQSEEIGDSDTLVESNSDGGSVDSSKVDPGVVGDGVKSLGSSGSGGGDGEGVEEVLVLDGVRGGRDGNESLLEDVGEGVDLGGDSSKTSGTVVAEEGRKEDEVSSSPSRLNQGKILVHLHSVHGSHVGEQSLSSADVTGSLLPSDVLLSSYGAATEKGGGQFERRRREESKR